MTPLVHEQMLNLLLELLEQSTFVFRGIGLANAYASVNQDNATARKLISDRATNICQLAYQIAFRASNPGVEAPAYGLASGEMPTMPTGAELDRAIYSGACQHIADVARFTGNLSRMSDSAMREKTAALLRDWADNLSDQMTVEIEA